MKKFLKKYERRMIIEDIEKRITVVAIFYNHIFLLL